MLTPPSIHESGGSFRAYAKRRGTSANSVSRAFKSGRLKASISVHPNGQPWIHDFDLADQEWAANTDHSKAPAYVKERGVEAVPQPSAAGTPGTVAPGTPAPGDDEPLSLSEASAEEKRWKAKLAELEFLRKSEELVSAKEAQTTWVDEISRARTKLLGLPSKMKSAYPELTHAQVLTFDACIREALEDLAVPPAAAAPGSAA